LAERLYAAATAKDPQRPTARAEHLAIRVIQGGEQRPELLDELRSLASDNMENRFVVGRLFDIYIETDAYRQMHDFCVDALDTMPNSPILHRNLAISLHRLGRDEDEVVAAFENAMEVARRYNEGRVNTIRPYLAYLVDKAISVEHESAKTELLDRARQLVVEGLRLEPTEAQLYMQLGRILAEERDDAAAKAIVAIGVKYASPTERIVLNDQLLRLNALSELQGLIPSLSAERLQQASRSPVVILDATDEQQGSEPV
jgi:tetratricopeptide (TPR) repeat protein